MAKIPHFKSLDDAAEFWETHDFEDFVDMARRYREEARRFVRPEGQA